MQFFFKHLEGSCHVYRPLFNIIQHSWTGLQESSDFASQQFGDLEFHMIANAQGSHMIATIKSPTGFHPARFSSQPLPASLRHMETPERTTYSPKRTEEFFRLREERRDVLCDSDETPMHSNDAQILFKWKVKRLGKEGPEGPSCFGTSVFC